MKRYTAEEIIGHLRTLEIEMGKGLAVVDACRKIGITEQSFGTSCSMGSSSLRCGNHLSDKEKKWDVRMGMGTFHAVLLS